MAFEYGTQVIIEKGFVELLFIFLRMDQYIVYCHFEGLEEAAGIEFFLPLVFDITDYIFSVALFIFIFGLMYDSFGQGVVYTVAVGIDIQVLEQVIAGIFRLQLIDVFIDIALVSLPADEKDFIALPT